MAHNTALGQAAGITEEQVRAIGSEDYMGSPHLSPRERAAVLWAEHVTRNTARHRDDVFEEVRRHFSEAEVVELTAVCALFNMSNRIHDSLRLPIEPQEEVNKIRSSVRVDPARLRSYLEGVLARWPGELPGPEGAARAGGPEKGRGGR